LPQIIGTALGVVIGPCIFFIFYRAFPIGDPNGMFPAPYATIYRAMAILGTQGLKALPKHCTQLFAGFFFAAIIMSMLRVIPEHLSPGLPTHLNLLGQAEPHPIACYPPAWGRRLDWLAGARCDCGNVHHVT
jgi:OPT oligopeptide transporter protein